MAIKGDVGKIMFENAGGTEADVGQTRSWSLSISKDIMETTKQGDTFKTNIEYAEPVAYGTSLPPSWGGQYRTRQNTIKGYPELVAKQLEQYIVNEFRKA